MVEKSPLWKLFYTDGKGYKTDKTHKNAWCSGCLDDKVRDLKFLHAAALARGEMDVDVETDDNYWISKALAAVKPICGKVLTMKSHKSGCSLIRSELKAEVDALLANKSKDTTGYAPHNPSNMPSLRYEPQLPPGYGPTSTTASRISSRHPTLSPLSNIGELTGSQLFDAGSSPPKRPKQSHSFNEASFSPPSDQVHRQEEFLRDITRLICSCELSWYILERPQFRHFVNKWIPNVHLPSRRVASDSLLDAECNRVIAKTRMKIDGKFANYQCDGWKNCAKTSVISSVILVENTPYPVRTHDMSGRPKTGDELFSIVKEDIAYIGATYGVQIISVVTDDGPDGKKMRRLIKEDPDLPIAALECWAHQSSLMTGNYLAVKAPFMDAVAAGGEIIKWFNNHGKALDLLHNQQMLVFGQIYALFLPILTRWTSNFSSLARLVSQEAAILGCVAQFRDQLLLAGGPKADAKEKAQEIITRCLDSTFWTDLKRVVSHLKPLAIASNLLQAPTCRLDHVLLTLGNIYDFFDVLDDDEPGNKEIKEAMRKSIERRWGKTDQELFILATFFNPYIRAKYFNEDHINFMHLLHAAQRTFKRLTKHDVTRDPQFMNAIMDYFNEEGDFSPESMCLAGWQDLYAEKGDPETYHINVVKIWQGIKCKTTSSGRGAFIDLAIRVLGIVPNSASTECLFSMFGTTHTKRRNRLSPQKVHKAAIVRMDEKRIYKECQAPRKKRNFDVLTGIRTPTVMEKDDQGEDGDVVEEAGLLAAMAEKEVAEKEQEEPEGVDPSTQPVPVPAEGLAALILEAEKLDEDEIDDESLQQLGEDDDMDRLLESSTPFTTTVLNPQRTPAATPSHPAPTTRPANSSSSRAWKRIKLVDLLIFDVEGTDREGLKFYWEAGELLTNREAHVLETVHART